MLRPQRNAHRDLLDLSGIWDFRPEQPGDDPTDWSTGFDGGEPIAVPGSWNEQLPQLRDFCGIAWYQCEFHAERTDGKAQALRFGSVNYAADVWLNGTHLGSHSGGHLPFAFDVTDAVLNGTNHLVVRVDNELRKDRVPPGSASGVVETDPGSIFGALEVVLGLFKSNPAMSADFFPFGGIHRPVVLATTDVRAITSIRLTETDPHSGVLSMVVEAPTGHEISLSVGASQSSATSQSGMAELSVVIDNVTPWSPSSPVLYDAVIQVTADSQVVDTYTLPVGMRTIEVQGDQVLLNGEPVVMRGFGRHEDFAVIGRGQFPAGDVLDHSMMRWMGADSYRTSHYPYSEEQLDLADRLGFLVIAETPAVGLEFGDQHEAARLAACIQMTNELIERDRNRACVVAWSLANEPMAMNGEAAATYFTTLVDHARTLDDRPFMVVNPLASSELIFPLCDIIGLNRYPGWYSEQGDIAGGIGRLSKELDDLHELYGKPIFVTEFGCDTIPGHHAEPPEMWSEEYQAQFLDACLDLFDSKPFVVGQHIWNLADFKTGQGVLRAGAMNHKGVLTRDRRPKLAAHRLRARWVTQQA